MPEVAPVIVTTLSANRFRVDTVLGAGGTS
jgi:hypothetical protein